MLRTIIIREYGVSDRILCYFEHVFMSWFYERGFPPRCKPGVNVLCA
jgi:hypothetical protein